MPFNIFIQMEFYFYFFPSPPHGRIIIAGQSNASKDINSCVTTLVHVVLGSKLKKFARKLSFEQNAKTHHKFCLLINYITIYTENSNKTSS
jgi:hypothetical protein